MLTWKTGKGHLNLSPELTNYLLYIGCVVLRERPQSIGDWEAFPSVVLNVKPKKKDEALKNLRDELVGLHPLAVEILFGK